MALRHAKKSRDLFEVSNLLDSQEFVPFVKVSPIMGQAGMLNASLTELNVLDNRWRAMLGCQVVLAVPAPTWL